jgi:hypothetical protein
VTILVLPENRLLKNGPKTYFYVYVEINDHRIYCGSVNKQSSWDKAAKEQREHYETRITHYENKIAGIPQKIANLQVNTPTFWQYYTEKNGEKVIA